MAQETVTHILVDSPNLRECRRESGIKVGDAFNSVSIQLGGSKEDERGKPDSVSRARMVTVVLDFAEASQRFRSRVPQGQPNTGGGNYVTAGLDEALCSFSGSGSLYIYAHGYI